MTEAEKIDKFIETARSMIGAKWRHRGRKPWAVDCVGLVILSLASVDFPVKDKNDYSRFPWQDGLREALVSHFGDPVPDIKRGDVVLMKFDNSPEPSHVGIIADYVYGGLSLIHSYSLQAVIEHRYDAVWQSRTVEVFRPWRN